MYEESEDDTAGTLSILEKRRAGLKGTITRFINDIKGLADCVLTTNDKPDCGQIDAKFASIDEIRTKLQVTHQMILSITGEQSKQQEANEYMRHISDNVENARLYVHNLIPCGEETVKNCPEVKPEDSASGISSFVGSTASKLSAARAKAAARASKLASAASQLEEMQRLELQELQIQQRRKALELKLQLEAAHAETEAYETASHISRMTLKENTETMQKGKNRIQQNVKQDKPQLDPCVTPWYPPHKEVKQRNVEQQSSAKSPQECDWMQLMYCGQQQQQKILDSLQVPKIELTYFNGDPLKYWLFTKQFDTNVNVCNANDCQKLLLLTQYCTGKAKNLIESCLSMDPSTGYARARYLLKERYGNEFLIADTWVKRLADGPTLGNNDRDGLQDFADVLRNCVENMSAMGMLSEISTQGAMLQIVQRLPNYLKTRWLREVQRIRKRTLCNPSINDLVIFVEEAARECNDPVYGDMCLQTGDSVSADARKGSTQRGGSTFNTQVNESRVNNVLSCPLCQERHYLFGCARFKDLNVDNRRQLVVEKRLCFNCLKPGHNAYDCRLDRRCSVEGCGKKHTKFLHQATRINNNQRTSLEQGRNNDVSSNDEAQDVVTSTCRTAVNNKIALPIVQIKVRSTKSPKSIIVNALLDSGSTNSFCSEAMVNALGIVGEPNSISLTTLGAENRHVKTTSVDIEISPLDDDKFYTLQNVFTRDAIPIGDSTYGSSNEISNWQHLRHLNIPDLGTSTVSLLIGQDNPDIILPRDICSGPAGAPYATRTVLGWSLNGPLGIRRSSSKHNVTSNFIATDTELQEQVTKFWKIEDWETIGCDMLKMSMEDRQAIEIWESSIQQDDQGHYTLDIPMKCEVPNKPTCRRLAQKRLTSLKRRLQRDEELRDQYTAAMQALFDEGYAEPVSPTTDRNTPIWYLPHHPVFNPQKPGKLRIVFDCAAKVDGVSLNDCTLQGPDLANTLLGVLLRFRQGPIAVTADIKAMFQQVHVTTSQRDLLRFLWWPNGNINEEPTEYRMLTHLFGGKWSPSCCNFALKKIAENQQTTIKNKAEQVIKSNFYVDDCLVAFDDEEEAITTMADLTTMLKNGGFTLTKFTSNSRKVLTTIPEVDRANKIRDIDLNYEALPVDRTLGVQWNVEEDCFGFNIKKPDKPLTRRGLLSAVTSVYDPLGLISPFTLRARKLIQDLTRKGIGWDEALPRQERDEWINWTAQLSTISGLKFPRAFKSSTEDIMMYELHHFSDASQYAYGVVSYLRTTNKEGNFKCHLVMSKAKLAPINVMTIPRLELTAAALATKMDTLIRTELQMDSSKSYFWTDSQIVLSYINSTSKRFHTYVANRLSVIHAASSIDQWQHIETQQNPADEVSRGQNAYDLVGNTRWTKGPEFLTCTGRSVPQKREYKEVPETDPEVKAERSCDSHFVTAENTTLDELLEKYSSWYKAKRAVAWLLRLKSMLYRKIKNEPPPKLESTLSVVEMNRAETAIVVYVQQKTLAKEIGAVKAKKGNGEPLHKLHPYIAPDQVLRVGGRISKSDLSENQKHSAIMPKSHHVVDIIIRSYHVMSGHSGREHVLSLTRQRFWIIAGRQAVRRALHTCVTCRRTRGPLGGQVMADLPECRMQADKAAFTNVGVDIFGPILVRRGRSDVKRYGCIFTCMTMRAIHLETTQSLDTDSFINALQRFISRRGRPAAIWCDNGTNFVGAEKQLTKSLKAWNQEKLHNFLLQREISWNFIPPRASHMGGTWERMIRTVRKVLAPLLHQQRLDDEGLNTLLCMVEAVVNSRPLTPVSDDAKDLAALTPNHLLTPRAQSQLTPGLFCKEDMYVRRKWRQIQYLTDVFWRRWTREYIPMLQGRQKWTEKKRNFQPGDIVLIAEEMPRNVWPLGRVVEAHASDDGCVRSVKVKTSTSTLTRPITKICLLEAAKEQDQH